MSNAVLAPNGGELLHLLPKKGPPMAGHTTMPPRTQRTPFGDVTLTSRWKRDRYALLATGPMAALRWMFPRHQGTMEAISARSHRHEFPPSASPITVERDLRRVCAAWQSAWDERMDDTTSVLQEPSRQLISDGTLGDTVKAYLRLRAGELAESSLEKNRHYLDRWVGVLGAKTPLADLTEDRLVAGRTALAKELRASTLNCLIATLKTVLRWAEERDILVHKAHQRFKRVKNGAHAREKAWWTPDEVDLVLQAAREVDADLAASKKQGAWSEDPANVGILLISLGCLLGLRYEEIIMLRWGDLDMDQVDQWTGTPAPVAHIVPKEGWTPKDGESRTIPMHQRLVEILRPHRQSSGWVLNAHKAMPKRGGTKRIYRYDPKKVWLRVLARAKEKGAKVITPHGMSHAFASILLLAGVSDTLIARWLGHADTSMVHLHYGHLLAYHGDINRVQIGPVGAT